MFKQRLWSPGLNRAPKAEYQTTGGPYTRLRLYLMPQPVPAQVTFSQYDWDFILAPLGNINYKCGVYERVGSLSGGTFTLVSGTSVTVNNRTTSFYTTALGSTKVLPPAHYYIGFIFEDNAHSSLTHYSAHTPNTWITGDWLYVDQVSLTLPSTIAASTLGYVHAVSEAPFWCALTYIGDVIP